LLKDTPFTFGNPLSENTKIFAKWTATETANYVVIIWKQNVNGDGYDFVESVSVPNATVGAAPSAVNGSNGSVDGAKYNGEKGFHFKETDQATKIVTPEGNTVVNVYWDRTKYTLTFQVRQG
jgi:hypothetical protein